MPKSDNRKGPGDFGGGGSNAWDKIEDFFTALFMGPSYFGWKQEQWDARQADIAQRDAGKQADIAAGEEEVEQESMAQRLMELLGYGSPAGYEFPEEMQGRAEGTPRVKPTAVYESPYGTSPMLESMAGMEGLGASDMMTMLQTVSGLTGQPVFEPEEEDTVNMSEMGLIVPLMRGEERGYGFTTGSLRDLGEQTGADFEQEMAAYAQNPEMWDELFPAAQAERPEIEVRGVQGGLYGYQAEDPMQGRWVVPPTQEEPTPQIGDVSNSLYSRIDDNSGGYGQYISDVAARFNIPTSIFFSQALHESGGRMVSGASGEQGIFQIMPETAIALGIDPSTPDGNIQGAASYLAGAYQKYGDWKLALAAYNAGYGRIDQLVSQYGNSWEAIAEHLPRGTNEQGVSYDTRSYVERIMGTASANSLAGTQGFRTAIPDEEDEVRDPSANDMEDFWYTLSAEQKQEVKNSFGQDMIFEDIPADVLHRKAWQAYNTQEDEVATQAAYNRVVDSIITELSSSSYAGDPTWDDVIVIANSYREDGIIESDAEYEAILKLIEERIAGG